MTPEPRVHPDPPETPAPDEKDWTWTLSRICPDCGFDASGVDRSAIPTLVRESVARFAGALARPDAGQRPAPATWSVLEYACHARDVCATFTDRVELMRSQDNPRFANWDQDATALAERYWEQDRQSVGAQLEVAAEVAATAFARVRADEWDRRGVRSNGSEFTIDTLGRYFLHDLHHHVWDVGG